MGANYLYVAVFLTICCGISIGELDLFQAMPLLTERCILYRSLLNYEYYQIDNTTREPDVTKLQFYLYNESQVVLINITTAASELFASPLFDKNLPVMIYTHGFFSGMTTSSALISTAFLKKGGYNVLALDTKNFIYLRYIIGTTNLRFIGEALGNFLVQLNEGGIPASNIYLIGHSLGAHISGFAGKTFNASTGTKISRISALDPAGPCFFGETDEYRLCKTDAEFVDVIHTDAGSLGDDDLYGHVDFFPNGGRDQPGTYIPGDSHTRAWELFGETVNNPTNFPALKCTNFIAFSAALCTNGTKNYMGFGATADTETGAYYLKTNGKSTFGKGESGISFPADQVAVVQLKWEEFLKKIFSG